VVRGEWRVDGSEVSCWVGLRERGLVRVEIARVRMGVSVVLRR